MKKADEFSYDFEGEGTDFTKSNMPRKFRNLKTNVASHLKSKNHKIAKDNKAESDKMDEKIEHTITR